MGKTPCGPQGSASRSKAGSKRYLQTNRLAEVAASLFVLHLALQGQMQNHYNPITFLCNKEKSRVQKILDATPDHLLPQLERLLLGMSALRAGM
jgi:hypothetical protein